MEIGLTNKSLNPSPEYKNYGDSGMDVRSNIPDFVLQPLERKLVPTGLFFDIPTGFEIQVRPRSGLALKNGITVLNTPGTVDSCYTGELCIILINLSNENFNVNFGDRIAQIVLQKVEKIDWYLKGEIVKETERGVGGFGSTGLK